MKKRVHERVSNYHTNFVTGALMNVSKEIIRLSYFNEVKDLDDETLKCICEGELIFTEESAEIIRDLLDKGIEDMREIRAKNIPVPSTKGLKKKIEVEKRAKTEE